MNKKIIYIYSLAAMSTLLLTSCSSSITSVISNQPADPFESIHTTVSECELGDNFDLLKSVSYDSALTVKINDKGDFNTNKPGTYTITYNFADADNKSEDITFQYTVKDTVAPTINLHKDEIYIKQGETFDINTYASATDKSKNTEINYDGNLDLNKEGVYNISVYATDDSNNKSSSKDLKVNVINRDDCIVRNVKFGDSKEIVELFEDAEPASYYDEYKDDTQLIYTLKLNGIDTELWYMFNDNKLTKIAYLNTSTHVNAQSYINDFDEIEEILESKYGKPDEKNKKNNLKNYYTSEGDAIMMGYGLRIYTWNKEGYTITHYCTSDDSYGIDHSIVYESDDFVPLSEINKDDL